MFKKSNTFQMVPILLKLHCSLTENSINREVCSLGPDNMVSCVPLQIDFKSIGFPHILRFGLLSLSHPFPSFTTRSPLLVKYKYCITFCPGLSVFQKYLVPFLTYVSSSGFCFFSLACDFYSSFKISRVNQIHIRALCFCISSPRI